MKSEKITQMIAIRDVDENLRESVIHEIHGHQGVVSIETCAQALMLDTDHFAFDLSHFICLL